MQSSHDKVDKSLSNGHPLGQTKGTLHFLLLWQGEGASVTRQFIDKFRIRHKDILIDTVDELDTSLKKNYRQKFESLVDECHAAIALLTPDPRPASEAGNLWYEIGYWLARKSSDTIIILQIDDAHQLLLAEGHDPREAKIHLISDLSGAHVERCTSQNWLDGAQGFIRDIEKLFNTGQLANDDQEAFEHAFFDKHRRPSLEFCAICARPVHGGQCNFRKDAIIFAAELLAITDMTQKHLEIQDIFRSITFHSQVLIKLDEMNIQNIDLKTVRDNFIIDLADDFDKLFSIESRHNFDLGHFLTSRLIHHKLKSEATRSKAGGNLIPEPNLPGLGKPVFGRVVEKTHQEIKIAVAKCVTDFLKWGQDFTEKYTTPDEDYHNYILYGADKEHNDKVTDFWRTKLKATSTFSASVARAMVGWEVKFYHDYRHGIKDAKEKSVTFHSIFRECASTLPHRTENSKSPFAHKWVYED